MEIIARWPGTCSESGKRFRRGDRIDYNPETKTSKLVYAVPRAKSRYERTDYAIDRANVATVDRDRLV